MSAYQIAYTALLALAIWYGKPDWKIAALCIGNFTGTMALAESPLSVGVLDMTTATLFIAIGTRQAKQLALAFSLIPIVYVLGVKLQWSFFTIYAIADVFAVVILGVLASGSGGNSKRARHGRFNLGRVIGPIRSQASWRHNTVARHIRLAVRGKSRRLTRNVGGLYRGN